MANQKSPDIPKGISGLCFLALGFHANGATGEEIRQWLNVRGQPLRRARVHGALFGLAQRTPPLVELAQRREGGRPAGTWVLSPSGRRLFRAKVY